MNFFTTLVSVLNSIYIPDIHIMDIIEIVLLIFTLYKVITHIVDTRAMVVIQGLLYMFGIYVIAYLLNFSAIITIFQNIMTVCLFAILLIFQPELRRFVESVGTNTEPKLTWLKNRIFHKGKKVILRYSDNTVDSIVDACVKMGKAKTGALIVFEMDIPLKDYVRSGIDVNADLSSALLINIFEKNTPLHDGAVIVKGDTIVSATCYLPLTNSMYIDKNLGTRHRAAIGVSEVTDSVVVTVSEETGAISFVQGGNIHHNLTADELKKELKAVQVKDEEVKLNITGNSILKLKHNLGYKIIAFLVGIIGWVLLINISNPVYTETFVNVPIVVENENILTEQNKTYSLDKEYVSVAVTSSRKDVEKLTADDIIVKADMGTLTLANAIELKPDVPKLSDKSVSVVGDSFVRVTVDDLVTEEFNIISDVILDKAVKNEIMVGNVALTQSTVSVTGASRVLARIGEIKATKVIDSYTDNFSDIVSLKVYDKNGDELAANYTLSIDKVGITGTLYNAKEVPLNIEVTEVNATSNYSVWKLKYSQEKVRIAGNSIALANMDTLNINIPLDMRTINVTDENNEHSFTIDLNNYIPDTIKLMGDPEVNVTVVFSVFDSATLLVSANDVELRNLSKGYSATVISGDTSVSINGATSDMQDVSASDLKPYVDLSGKTEGEYLMDVSFSNIGDLKVTKNGSIRVLVSKKVSPFVPVPTVTPDKVETTPKPDSAKPDSVKPDSTKPEPDASIPEVPEIKENESVENVTRE